MHDAPQLVSEQEVQLGDGHGFRQHNGDRHEDPQISGLVVGQQFHVVGHVNAGALREK